MKTVLVAALVLVLAPPSLGQAQDTARTARRVEKLVTPRRDSIRQVSRDSVRFLLSRDSIRWVADTIRFVPREIRWDIPKDSVQWLPHIAEGRQARHDTARVRWLPPLEAERTVASAISIQNGNGGFAQHLFPPEFVMQHQSRLRLTEQQRNFIVAEITKLQATAVQLQWRVADESEKLSELLSHDSVAETAALEQVDKVIGFETAVKRAQLSMLIRIRNVLTAEQRAMLRGLQKQRE